MDSPSPWLYLVIVGLLACSAFFSMSETAISTVNKLRLRKKAEEGDKRARAALSVSEDYDRTLFSILIGNNIVNITMSSVATIIATYWFGASGAVVSTVTITVLVLVFGEVIPKSYGNARSERVALGAARVIKGIAKCLTPVIWLLMRLKDAVVRTEGEPVPTVTEKELLFMLESIEEEGVLEEQERDLVQSALEFDEIAVKEIITPRVDIVAVDIEDSPGEIKQAALEEGYSRIPVYEGSIDNIIGVLITRDYLQCLIRGEEPDLRSMLHDPLFVHRSMKLSYLLTRLKAEKMNLAVVTDDYGGTLGIVTMEDVLEELVGEIWDEDDDEVSDGFVRTGEASCEVQGSHSLRELFEELGREDMEQEHDYSTVNGWAMSLFGHIPQVGETLEHEDMKLAILEMDGHRIRRLGLRIDPPEEAGENPAPGQGRAKDRRGGEN